MALTPEILKSNFPDLPETTITKLAELSSNDENAVIAKKMGETHGRYDQDFQSVLGITKPAGVKSYDFWKQQTQELKTKADQAGTLQTTIEKLTDEKTELETQIQKGSGDKTLVTKIQTLETQISDHKNTIANLEKSTTQLAAEHQKALQAKELENFDFRKQSYLANALAGVKWKNGMKPDDFVIKSALKNAEDILMKTGKPEFDENGEMIFRGENNQLIPNPDNLQRPITGREKYLNILKPIIDGGKQQPGGGTGGQGGAGGSSGELDLSSVTTKTQATKVIRASLAEQGIAAGSSEHQEKFDKLYGSEAIQSLPLK